MKDEEYQMTAQALLRTHRILSQMTAERDALREIVQWVADVPWYLVSEGYACAGCDK